MGTWQFLTCVVGVVIAIILLKIFFTLWKVVDKKLHPEMEKIGITPEVAFNNLRNKNITVFLKDGKILTDLKYIKTLFFNDGEYSLNTVVYFEVTNQHKRIFISGTDIVRIETNID